MGELQDDWDNFFDELDNIDFSGKKVAYFGVGDQNDYPYKLWGQFNRNGEIITADFWVKAT
ncbi:hypothetical protein CAL7716_081290 [Calothrix sp. PCC 7716]|nr:hypothetical protein CAL7716_081290 [Calothrix sp. PCC 7716]